MRIENLRTEKAHGQARAMADITWEDCDRPSRTILFETDEAFADDLTCNPHSFLLACCFPALRHGEERIVIEEAICPEMRNGLITAMGWIREWWYPPQHKLLRIEAKAGIRSPLHRTVERAGAFLSGGVDSLTLVRCNRLDYPTDHPNSIRDCLIVHGFDIGAKDGLDWQTQTFKRAVTSVSAVTQDVEVTTIPVLTNIRHLDDDVNFWMHEFHGAALAAVAHTFSTRFSKMYIASSFSISQMVPWGSHPLLDPQYSSAELKILHEGIRLSRLEKIKILADWDIALQNLRVCTANTPGMLNCGKCEKCIRTMTQLLAVDKLASTHSFPVHDVSDAMLRSITIESDYQHAWYQDLINPLTACGRSDLVTAIRTLLAQYQRRRAWEEERDWKGSIKKFDRKYLGSSMYKSYKTLRASAKRHGVR